MLNRFGPRAVLLMKLLYEFYSIGHILDGVYHPLQGFKFLAMPLVIDLHTANVNIGSSSCGGGA